MELSAHTRYHRGAGAGEKKEIGKITQRHHTTTTTIQCHSSNSFRIVATTTTIQYYSYNYFLVCATTTMKFQCNFSDYFHVVPTEISAHTRYHKGAEAGEEKREIGKTTQR